MAKWEEQFAVFKAHDSMPERDSVLYDWRKTQLRNGRTDLDYNTEKESESNEGGTVWRDRKVRPKDCIASKKSA
jgi:hypothetical protein